MASYERVGQYPRGCHRSQVVRVAAPGSMVVRIGEDERRQCDQIKNKKHQRKQPRSQDVLNSRPQVDAAGRRVLDDVDWNLFPTRRPRHTLHQNIFVGDAEHGARSEVLDIHNALVHLQDGPEWKQAKERGLRLYTWAPDDPLADVFLMQFGEYPNANEIHIDYRGFLKNVGEAKEVSIHPASKLPADLFAHPSIAFVSRYRLERH